MGSAAVDPFGSGLWIGEADRGVLLGTGVLGGIGVFVGSAIENCADDVASAQLGGGNPRTVA